MNEDNTQPQSDEPSVGQILKTHRENANISLAKIASLLKLTESQVQHIENDEYHLLGAKTFVKGYIKNYCRTLNIDSTAILAMLPAFSTSDKPVDMQSFSRRTEKEAHDSRLMTVSYLILAIVIGSSAVWWWQNATPIDEQTNTINANNSFITQQQENTKRLAEAADEVQLDDVEPAQQTNSALQNEQQTIQAAPLNDAQSPSEPTNTDLSTIFMMFNDESWVEIHDANDEKIAFGVKKAGYEMTLTGVAPFSVVLGKHDVVSITLNGEPVDISAFPKNRLAKFKLPLAE
ncbi:cytoskeleton protein RodZ [Pseudoalteromonas sp. BSi20311]|jgi:cytoskeleton protein RodZ|uniref:RodZ domain-containing protein n=1 Tax=unclassified Pseudoalteromonas TaxID=194690 RepID=UPI0002316DCE|nr:MULTISPECIES: RodZ domain-containing protein [unclassified Pseudoalteromonas]GAA63721.1 cytoskeleton protein RodZ [Pseudoalteromonas sp. BSi20311]GAA73343.1 cytoskeleton protein RodZ [Pseudoalteromonas sp. BSi20439]|tara:strand:- start:381 stop:1250 length:870 start_codon:yes stop_codon:yes gene_type:complete